MAENKPNGPRHNVRDTGEFYLKEFKYKTDQRARIDAFAKKLGIDKYKFRSYIESKMKPGLKILGKKITSKRIFNWLDEAAREGWGKRISKDMLTNKDIKEMSKTLSKISQQHQLKIQESKARGPTSKIVPFSESPHGPRPNYPISTLPRLKHLTKLHEIPWKVVQDAIDAFKTTGGTEQNVVKQLIKTLDNESVDSDVLRKFIQDQTRRITDPVGLLKDWVKKYSDIRWRTIQNALDMGKSPHEILADLKGKTGKVGFNIRPSGEIDFTGEHEYAEELQKDFKKKNAERRARDKLYKSASNKIVPRTTKIWTGSDLAKRASLQIKQLTELTDQAQQAYKDRVLPDPSRIGPGVKGELGALRDKLTADLARIKRRSRRWDRIDQLRNKKMRLGALKSGLGNLGAGIVLNALSNKYLAPLARKAGTKLGESLVPVGRKIDQLLIKKKKKDD